MRKSTSQLPVDTRLSTCTMYAWLYKIVHLRQIYVIFQKIVKKDNFAESFLRYKQQFCKIGASNHKNVDGTEFKYI